MVRDGEVFLIDYQGLRLGRPEYDVASLLYDPYVEMAAGERAELLRVYYEMAEPEEAFDEWLEVFYRSRATGMCFRKSGFPFSTPRNPYAPIACIRRCAAQR